MTSDFEQPTSEEPVEEGQSQEPQAEQAPQHVTLSVTPPTPPGVHDALPVVPVHTASSATPRTEEEPLDEDERPTGKAPAIRAQSVEPEAAPAREDPAALAAEPDDEQHSYTITEPLPDAVTPLAEAIQSVAASEGEPAASAETGEEVAQGAAETSGVTIAAREPTAPPTQEDAPSTEASPQQEESLAAAPNLPEHNPFVEALSHGASVGTPALPPIVADAAVAGAAAADDGAVAAHVELSEPHEETVAESGQAVPAAPETSEEPPASEVEPAQTLATGGPSGAASAPMTPVEAIEEHADEPTVVADEEPDTVVAEPLVEQSLAEQAATETVQTEHDQVMSTPAESTPTEVAPTVTASEPPAEMTAPTEPVPVVREAEPVAKLPVWPGTAAPDEALVATEQIPQVHVMPAVPAAAQMAIPTVMPPPPMGQIPTAPVPQVSREAATVYDAPVYTPPPPRPYVPPATRPAPAQQAMPRGNIGCASLLGVALLVTVAVLVYFGIKAFTGPSLPPGVYYQSGLSSVADGWVNERDCTFQADGYHVTGPSACFYSNRDFGNGTMSVTMRRVTGSADAQSGLAFRRVNNGKFYSFMVDGSGNWYLYKSSQLVKTGANSAIKSGNGLPNTLQVAMSGANFLFLVNGTQVATWSDGEFTTGKIGLTGDTDLNVVYTNITVRK